MGGNAQFELVPNLVDNWKQINDTRWEFELRKDGIFHNGKPMAADEVKASLEKSNCAVPYAW